MGIACSRISRTVSFLKAIMTENVQREMFEQKDDVVIPVNGASGKYSLAVIDPPWNWKEWGVSISGNARRAPYEKLDVSALASLPISRMLEDDAAVILWVIDSMLPQAMKCVEAWGLSFRTVGFYWTKEKPSGKEHIGLGYYTRANPEQAWILTKGKGIRRQSRAVRRWIHAPSGAHSEKPDIFYRKVDELFGNIPRVDVFARKRREGWDVIGNEIDGRDIREVLIEDF